MINSAGRACSRRQYQSMYVLAGKTLFILATTHNDAELPTVSSIFLKLLHDI
jgi:hypothetical protein